MAIYRCLSVQVILYPRDENWEELKNNGLGFWDSLYENVCSVRVKIFVLFTNVSQVHRICLIFSKCSKTVG